MFDVVVLGNGSIGTLCAIQIKKKHPGFRVCLVGYKNRINGASAAAGAMCNVFAEVEAPYSKQHADLIALSLDYAISGREGWLDFLGSSSINQSIKTAEDTLVFLKEDATDFEHKNYLASKSAASSYGVLKTPDPKKMQEIFNDSQQPPADAFLIQGEFALDTKVLFEVFDRLCSDLDVKVINEAVEGIDFEKSEVSIAGGRLRYKKLLVTLGSNSSMYLPKGAMPDLVQGVGTALELRDRGINRAIADSRIVIRTVNRGGAQCGFHLVPREAGFYLGAGNYIMLPGNSDHRLETIRYLFNTFERELCGPSSSYLLEGNLVKGHRPRAIDGYPVIGMIKGMPGVYVATGTNRAGLTWAPKIATQVLEWLDGEVSEDTKFSAMVSPSRANIDFGSEKEALAYYAESRLSAAVEHGKIENSAISRENELRRIHLYAEQLLGEARRVSLDDSSVPHPDHWSVILDRANTCIS